MYFAKMQQGPGSFAFFDASMNAHALQRLTIETNLRDAVARGELSLWFQPQFDLDTGHLAGLEALLRWTNPELGSVPTEEFIPIAEDGPDIADWAVVSVPRVPRSGCGSTTGSAGHAYCRQRLAPTAISQRFPGSSRGHIAGDRCAPTLLEIEITESAVMRNERLAIQTLTSLKLIGVSIAIDDFGTGYSSLVVCADFPIDRLKIDRALTRDIHRCAEDRAIAKAIIAMAHTLRFDVVAEGVEELAQLMVLQEERCAKAQGFLLSRPLPATEMMALLQRLVSSNQNSRTQRLHQLFDSAASA